MKLEVDDKATALSKKQLQELAARIAWAVAEAKSTLGVTEPETLSKEVAIRGGPRDVDAENLLIKELTPLINRFVRSRIGATNERWRDVAQEAMIGILIGLRKGNYDSAKGTVQSYAFGIAWKKILREWERGRRGKLDFQGMDEKTLAMIKSVIKSEDDDHNLRKLDVERMLDSLPEKHRSILNMRYLQGKSLKEIQLSLGLKSEQQVSNRISYASKLLRKEFRKVDLMSIFWLLLGNIMMIEGNAAHSWA